MRTSAQGSTSVSPVDRGWLGAVVVLGALAWAAPTALAQQPLACGESVTRSLAGGAEEAFSLEVTDAAVGHVDVTDVSATIGDLRLRGSAPGDDSCDGSLTLGVPSTVYVSDCDGNEAGNYAIAFNLVSDSPENCGEIVINTPRVEGRLETPGQVDAYRFLFSAGDAMIFTPDVESGSAAAVRIRIFDPAGVAVDVGDTCGQVQFESVAVGFFTALVSACSGTDTFDYGLSQTTGSPKTLACGETRVRSLALHDRDSFVPLVFSDEVLVTDLTDLSGTIGEFRIDQIGGAFVVRDADDQNSGEYSISLNVVSHSIGNCGAQLTCGQPLTDQTLAVQGETDAFNLSGLLDDTVTVEASGLGGHAIRLRAYDPSGVPIAGANTCSGRLDFTLADNRTYTVLVSACDGHPTGSYSIGWTTPALCSASTAPGEFAYVALDIPAIGVIDLGVNRLASAVLVPDDPDEGAAHLAHPANFGFVYANFAESERLLSVNTTTNQLVAEIPFATLGFAPDPSGAFVYVPISDAVIVIDTARRRVVDRVPLETPGDVSLIQVSPDGTALYMLAEGSPLGRIDVVALPSKAQTGIVDARLSRAFEMAVSPDGAVLYVIAGNGDVIIVDPHTASVQGTLPDVASVVALAFAPVGQRAYLLRDGDDGASLVEVDTTTHSPTGTMQVPMAAVSHVAVSSTGSRVVMTGTSLDSQSRYEAVIVDTTARRIIARIPLDAEPLDLVAGRPPQGLCTGDLELQTKVTVGELMTSVNFALDGCPGELQIEGASSRANR